MTDPIGRVVGEPEADASLRGKIIASCGHELADTDSGVDVVYGGENCDAFTGFHPCTFHAHFCTPCAKDWRDRGLLFKDDAEAAEWLRSESAKHRAQRSGS